MEIWKDIDDCDGMYQVSDMGRIRTYHNGKWGRRNTPNTKSPLDNGKGYLFIHMADRISKYKKRYIHRLVANAFIGKSDMEVNHINGNPSDNRLCNLEYVTHSENMKHAVYTLGKNRGRLVQASKLTEHDVFEIRQRLSAGETQSAIAKDYSVLQSTISDIATGRGWRWLTESAAVNESELVAA